jgi:hypothetical protein
LTISWQGQAFWLEKGTEDGGRNIELELKFYLEQKQGPALEQETQNTRTCKSLSQS